MSRMRSWFPPKPYAIGLAAVLVVIALIPVAIAQSRRAAAPPPGVQSASRALIEGRYDDVPGLVASLDQQDPRVVAVKAKALIARGKYQEAEATLRPAAQRAPTSDAALELALLMQMLGRSEADALLNRVADASASTDPLEMARDARVLRALGRMYDA